MSTLIEHLRNYAIGGDVPPPDLLEDAAVKIEKLEAEADKLAHEAAREAARANDAEAPIEVSDFLNMP